MILLHRLASIVRWLLRRKTSEQELHSELQIFIDLSTADKIRDGIAPEEARRLARLELRGIEQTKERVRTYRHGALLDELGRDLRYAFRTLVKNPGLTIVIVLTLALGIGANTAIFSLIDALMLRWLPVNNPQELVLVKAGAPERGPLGETLSYPIVRALADQTDIFAGVGGFSAASFNVGKPGSIIKVSGAMVTGGFYETCGVTPAIGRMLTREDDETNAPPVAVISYGYWERQFSRNPSAVGESILINGVPVTIVGVSAPGFVGANVGQVADITIAMATLPQVDPKSAGLLGPGNFWMRALARLKPGVSIPAAKAHLASVWPGISEQVISPRWPADRRKAMAESVFDLPPGGTGWTFLREVYRKPLVILMAVVAAVLLLACANVASLLLARASARQAETAVRLAIGASRGRIIRQLMFESTLLSLIGSVFGIVLAWLSSRFLVNLVPLGSSPVLLDLTPNRHILGFTITIAMATGVLFGITPAFQACAAGPSSILKETARITGPRSRLLPSLVIIQITISLVLLIGAILFVRTLQNLQNLDPGFNRSGVLLVSFQDGSIFRSELLEDVLRVPGVVSASISTHTPLSGATWSEPAMPQGQPLPQNDNAIFMGIGPRYFETMETPLVTGRGFDESDSANSRTVAVISEAYARRYFPGQNPIGQYLSTTARVGSAEAGKPRNVEIVGVAKDTNTTGLRRAPYPVVHVPYAQLKGDFPVTFEIRVSGSLVSAAAAIRAVLQQRLPSLPVEVRPLSEQVEATMVQERMLATLASGFAVLALILACIGLYGLLAYSVAQRTKEMGVRMALGAMPSRVIAMVLQSAVRLVLIGIGIGLPVAWAASHWIQSMLFGLAPTDPRVTTGAVLLLIAAAMIAAYIPARRASHVDPVVALRHE
jgi:predicted permease